MIVLIDRHSVADDHEELIAVDITDPEVLGEPVTVLETDAIIRIGDRTPWGVLVSTGSDEHWTHSVQEARVVDGAIELRPALPEGLSGYVVEAQFAGDHSWALASILVADNQLDLHRIDYDPEGVPLSSELVFADLGASIFPERFIDSGLLAFLVDSDDDGDSELRLVELLPEVGEATVIDEILIPPPAAFDMHLDATKLVYSNDLEQDGANERWSVDLADLAAPAVPVTTVIDGDWPVRARWSPSGDRMLYWTGASASGRLFYVEFDGATPSVPVLVSSEDGVLPSQFGFSSEDRLFYLTDDANDDQAIMLVDIAGEPKPAVRVAETLEPGYASSVILFDSDNARVVYSATDSEHGWISLLDLAAESPTPLRVYDGPATNGYLVPVIPEQGHIMPFSIPTELDARRLLAVDLDDPQTPILSLDATLPAGWAVPTFLSLTPDDGQVLFSTGPDDEVLVRVPVDGSGSVQELSGTGWTMLSKTVLGP